MQRDTLRLAGICAGLCVSFAGCGGSARVAPEPAPAEAPPGAGAWRPGEALARVLPPPPERVRPVDDDYLAWTSDYRLRMAATEERAPALRRIDRVDETVRRTWFLEGPDPILLHIDLEADGEWDQAQYFGPEGLFAVVHRFAEGRRAQRIYWPPGEERIVEIRDREAPFGGVWWRSTVDPFPPPR